MDKNIVPEIEISEASSTSLDINGNAVPPSIIHASSAENLKATLIKLDMEYKLVVAENTMLKEAGLKKDEIIRKIKAKFERLEEQLKNHFMVLEMESSTPKPNANAD